MEVNLSSDEENNCPPGFPVDIITISDGKALLDVSKFSEILSEAQDVSEKGLKVACICVIGEQKSGKSFLANMILQNLIANGNGNWIGPVTKKQNLLEGFSWNGLNAEDTPGIKMMSRPFSLKKDNGERIILLLMDLSVPSDDSHSRKLMETMACLLCPTIIVNQLNNIDMEFLNLHKTVFDQRQTPFSQRVVFTIRDFSPGSKKLLTYGWAKEQKYNAYVKELLQSSNRHELLSLWDGIQHKEVFAFTSPGNPNIVDEDGYLTLQPAFIAQMKKFVTEILDFDADGISHYQVPSMETIIEHFQNTISWLNGNFNSLLSIENPLSIKDEKPGPNENTPKKNDPHLNALNNLNGMPDEKQTKEKHSLSILEENLLQSFADSKSDHYAKNVNFDQEQLKAENQIDVPDTPIQEDPVGQKLAENRDNAAENDNTSEETQPENFNLKAIPDFAHENAQESIVAESNDPISPEEINKAENGKETINSADVSENLNLQDVRVSLETSAKLKMEYPVDKEKNTLSRIEKPNVSDFIPRQSMEEKSEDVLSMKNEAAKLENCKETANLASGMKNLNASDVCKSFEAPKTAEYTARAHENINIRCNKDVQHGNVPCLPSHKAAVEESKDLISFNESNNTEIIAKIGNSANTIKNLDTQDIRKTSEASATIEDPVLKKKVDININNEDVQQVNVSDLTTEDARDKEAKDLLSFKDSNNVENITESDLPVKSTDKWVLEFSEADPLNKENAKEQTLPDDVPNSENLINESSTNNSCQSKDIADGSAKDDFKSEKMNKQLSGNVNSIDASSSGNTKKKLRTSKKSTLSTSLPPKIMMCSQEKHKLDQNLQDRITRITQSYEDCVIYFVESERSLTQEKLQNRHSVLTKTAVEKLERVCHELKLGEEEKEEKVSILRKSLNFKHDQRSKKLNRSGKTGKSGKLPEDNLASAPVTTLKEENAIPESSAPLTSIGTNQTDLALKERIDKLLAFYNHNIVTFLQTEVQNYESLRNFHKIESEKLLKHMRDTFQNCSDFDANKFQNQLDAVCSSFVTVPEEDHQRYQFTDEEYQQKLSENAIQSSSLMMIATKHLLHQYDSCMESSFGGFRDVAQLNFCHQKFFNNLGVPEFWSPYGDQLKFLINLPNSLDYFNLILAKRHNFYEQHLQNQLARVEHAKKLIENRNQSVIVMMKATEYIQNKYDSHMENCLGRIHSFDQLNTFHRDFLFSMTTPVFWIQFGNRPVLDALFKVPNWIEDVKKILSKRFAFYEQRLKQHVREQNLISALLKCCEETYKSKIYDQVGTKISETGFSSAVQLVQEVSDDFVKKIVKNSFPGEDSQINTEQLVTTLKIRVKQELQNVMKLETILKAYIKEWDNKFQKEICFSDIILKNLHEDAKEHALNHAVAKVNNENFIKMSKIALDFAYGWCKNRNVEIQKFEREAAQLAMEIVKQFYKVQMGFVTTGKLYSGKKLTEKHQELKTQCVNAFKNAAAFYSNPEKTGLEDFSSILESEIENYLEEYLESNEKAMADAVKKLQAIISGSAKNFKSIMNGHLSEKSFDPLDFEKLYQDTCSQIIGNAKTEISEKIPTEGFQLHEENMQNQMNNDVMEMREGNRVKRNEEMLKIRKEREEHLKNEATRGCTLPFLCIEFNLDTLQAGFAQPDDKFVSLVDDHGNVVLENRISFLKDEFVVGTVSEGKSKEVLETLLLENLMDSSNELAENKKEIKFRGENFKIDLELFCSLIFTRLKESGENQSKEKFSTVVISVPLWFASRHRQVIKATAIIAGFEEVFLINDTSAAALGYFKSTGNISSCLVAAAGGDSCNAAVYSYSDGKMKMISCFGDRHINKDKSGFQKLTSFVFSGFSPLGSVKSQESNIYSTVIKEIKCDKKVDNAVIVLTNASDFVSSISKAIESKGINNVTFSENLGGENNWVVKGLCDYSRLLAQNIKSGRKSVRDLMQYKLTVTEDIEDHSKEVIPKYSKNNFNNNTKGSVYKKSSPKMLSFYEEATPLNRFHYGTAKFIVDKNDSVETKASASQEGIYDVELSKKGNLIAIDSYALSNEERDNYSAVLEKHFKKDPALEKLQNAKDLLKEIAEDMEQRFDQITVKSAVVRESILKCINDAIALAQNPSVDLQTVELKKKTLETWREKKFPKK